MESADTEKPGVNESENVAALDGGFAVVADVVDPERSAPLEGDGEQIVYAALSDTDTELGEVTRGPSPTHLPDLASDTKLLPKWLIG